MCIRDRGKTVYYQRAESVDLPDKSMLDYFSEVLPCGVIGSYLLDKTESSESNFAFKQDVYKRQVLDVAHFLESLEDIHYIFRKTEL